MGKPFEGVILKEVAVREILVLTIFGRGLVTLSGGIAGGQYGICSDAGGEDAEQT
jgi:hypothetical protein